MSPNDIYLNEKQKQQIAALAEQQNKPWEEVLEEALTRYAESTGVPPEQPQRPRRVPGSAKGKIWMAPDFDEPLEEFKDYM